MEMTLVSASVRAGATSKGKSFHEYDGWFDVTWRSRHLLNMHDETSEALPRGGVKLYVHSLHTYRPDKQFAVDKKPKLHGEEKKSFLEEDLKPKQKNF